MINPIFILYFHSIGDVSNKGAAFDEGLRRCYKNKQKIDEIVELFNTDFSSLNPTDAEIKIKQIQPILNSQKIKLGHLIDTSNKRKGNVVKINERKK